MSAALAGPFLETRREDALAPALVLAVAVHVLLAASLVLGVRWQSRAPDVIAVELWQPPPPPPPVVEPEPPKPVPAPAPVAKPEPRIEKPDIAIKEPAKPKPKPEAKPKPRPVAKPVPPKPDDRLAQQRLKEELEELARERQQLAAAQESQRVKDQMSRAAADARFKAIATWVDKVRDKIRGYIVLPLDIKGNPEALFLVTLLPTREVLEAKLVISSGHAGYDEAVYRAILKSSPLPPPDSGVPFERQLKLTFRPRD